MNNALSGVALLGLCAVGAYSTSSLPAPTPPAVVATAAVPTLALASTACCAVLLILQNLLRASATQHWANPRAILKVLAYFCFFCLYLWSMVAIGDALLDTSFPRKGNCGFTIATALYLLLSLPILGRRNPLEVGAVAVVYTGTLLGAFGVFFQIILP